MEDSSSAPQPRSILELPEVTLCCADTRTHALALRAMVRSMRSVSFGRAIFFTDAVPDGLQIPEGIEVTPIAPITSLEGYSRVVMKGLYPHVRTSHTLVVQWDGYVVHPEIWSDEFMSWDYIGAPWPGGAVGNGGFSLRSRRLLEVLQDESFPVLLNTEDVNICGAYRPRLMSDFGIRFADLSFARRFSFEMETRDALMGEKTFGFHGFFNFFLVESQSELISLAPFLPDSIVNLEATQLLLANLIQFELFESAVALGRRILEVDPENEQAAEAVVRARSELEAKRPAARRQTEGGGFRTMIQKLGKLRR